MALLKLYTDEHISKAIIKGLRNHGIDVLTCQEAGLISALDTEHLSFAREHGRIMITMDTNFYQTPSFPNYPFRNNFYYSTKVHWRYYSKNSNDLFYS